MIRPKSWKPGKLYKLGDRLPYGHPLRKSQGTMITTLGWSPLPDNGTCIMAEWTKEYRAPKKDEWFLSGCEGFEVAYHAKNDLSSKYFIMKPVLVERKTVTISKVIG